jgi:hypothetical protein
MHKTGACTVTTPTIQLLWKYFHMKFNENEMRIATWIVRTLYRAGAMREMVKEMDKYRTVYKQTLRSVKFTTGKRGKKTELTGKGPLRRRRSALDCSATEEEIQRNEKKNN